MSFDLTHLSEDERKQFNALSEEEQGVYGIRGRLLVQLRSMEDVFVMEHLDAKQVTLV